jgi:NAD(P)-dependent dehydrogenase (short-subunit alcohol dehydrogenase family)
VTDVVFLNSDALLSPFEKISPQQYRRVTDVSYLGYVYATMAVSPKMKSRDRGTIVHVGSAQPRGIFNHEASDRDAQLWASQHHGLLGAAGSLGLAAAAFMIGRRR